MSQGSLFDKTVGDDGVVSYDICEGNHRGNPESVDANPTDGAKQGARERVLVWFEEHGPAITEEAERGLGMTHQSCSARVTELKASGELVVIGQGTTSSGRAAALLAVPDDGTNCREAG